MSECKKLRNPFLTTARKVILITISALIWVNLTSCYSYLHPSYSYSSSNVATSSSDSSEEITYKDVPTRYPDLYKYSKNDPFYNTYTKSKIISYKKTGKYIGEDMTVQGKVSSVYFASTANGGPYFINFGNRDFCVVIWSEDFDTFDTDELSFLEAWSDSGDPMSVYLRVSGTISSYDDEPQIIVRDASQIAEKTDDGWKNMMDFVARDVIDKKLDDLKNRNNIYSNNNMNDSYDDYDSYDDDELYDNYEMNDWDDLDFTRNPL